MVWWFGGLRAPMLATFFSLALIAGLFLGPRGAAVALSLTLATTLTVFLAEGAGI